VAWVPQSGGLWPHCTAQEHLEIVRAAPEEAAALLCALGLGERRDARPHELSQGEQSRLSIARALASPAEVCLMDEPLAHVDPARAPQYWRAIRDRIAAAGASLVFATHSPETVIADANRVICLREGRLLHHGTADALYARPETEELMNFLGAGNWLTPAEAQRWLGLALAAPACLRPEQITIEPAASGAAEVIGARFMGAVAEAELRAADGARRIFFHRPSGPALAAGMRVSLQLARS
jgi:ABC-type Fe3+/spermidine/putrescine transport system ATPase subunit